MRSKLCIGFLTLFALCVPSLLMSLDASALKHEYDGLPILNQAVPYPQYDSSDDNYYIDWNNEASQWVSYGGSGFSLHFSDNSFDNLKVRQNLLFMRSSYNSQTGKCELSDTSSPILSMYSGQLSDNSHYIETPYNRSPVSFSNFNAIPSGQFYIPEYYFGNKMCWSRQGMNNIDLDSYSRNTGTINPFPNDLIAGPTHVSQFNLLPYNYMTDSLMFTDSHKQSDGVVYTKRFSFGMLFNKPVTSFSQLSLGLNDYGGFWYDSSNLYEDRSIDFHFLFSFDESFTLSQDFINRGHLQLQVNTAYEHNEDGHSSGVEYYDCTSRIQVVGDNQDYYWSIDCPVTLDRDYIVWVPSLSMYFDNNPVNILETTGDWSFSSVYIVTDNDATPGRHFNDSPTGNTNIYDQYWTDNDNQSDGGVPDWLQSLISMFTFSFINPFAPIFQMFSDNNSCAQIPTIASMIHSEETQVCPWFDSTTRNIVTPVLGLAAMMLVFGFAVRWLGSSSGNMFEDSSSETLVPPRNSGTWGRRKK